MVEQRHNVYTETWFELFLANQDASQTAREVEFLKRILPRSAVTHILDICCGYGRHAVLLAMDGYSVTGIDRDERVIERARSLNRQAGLTFRVHDMTRLRELPGPFDAAICMWQSFGYFDAETNADVLAQVASQLPPGGRLVLDLYNRDFFEPRQGERTTEQDGVEIVTRQNLEGDRLIVELDYRDRHERETFNWQVFTPRSIADLVGSNGFAPVLACSSFDENASPSGDLPRMQLVFDRK